MIKNNNFERLLNENGFVISGHSGNSMYPLIKQNDQLLMLKKGKEPNLYDIVVYKGKDKYILHRIIGSEGNNFIIRGDNCLNKEIIKKDKILGYLDVIYRNKQEIKINNELNKKYYYLSCLTLPYRKGKTKLKNIIRKLIRW